MHAGINYERYLAEIDVTDEDMRSWKAKFWTDNKWLPSFSEERSLDTTDEDLRQRIFMSKQDVAEAQAANPLANFSIMTPFSALTKEEFATKVLNAYVHVNITEPTAPATPTRSLRDKETSSIASIQDLIDTLQNSIQEQTGESWTPGTVKPVLDTTANEVDTSIAKQVHWKQPAPAPAPLTQAPTPAPEPKSATRQPVVEPVVKQDQVSVQVDEPIANTANSVDWSTTPCGSPVQSQGECGSCWAFASVTAVESLECIKLGQSKLNSYSKQQLISCDAKNMGCSGGAPAYAFDYIKKNGLCLESAYPYTLQKGGSTSCSTSCSKRQTGITGYEKLDEGDDAALIDALKLQPIVAAVASGNAAWKQYTGGILSSCETSSLDHAVVVVGYDDTTIKIQNSWGENWGEAGYIRLQRTSSSSGTCGLLEDMSRPTM
uniref:Peptidase C1A papain C-terminal domain-containing protein n=1 Tax=Peronospora matthiolae TaxID=2874970 RepID=A0AAV1TY09_9STRA